LVINWRIEEIKQIDRKTKKMPTIYKIHHQKVEVGRVYVKRKDGGRGVMQVEAANKAELTNIADYLNTNYKKTTRL
jgi:uncharacterized protein (DUF736 family)